MIWHRFYSRGDRCVVLHTHTYVLNLYFRIYVGFVVCVSLLLSWWVLRGLLMLSLPNTRMYVRTCAHTHTHTHTHTQTKRRWFAYFTEFANETHGPYAIRWKQYKAHYYTMG